MACSISNINNSKASGSNCQSIWNSNTVNVHVCWTITLITRQSEMADLARRATRWVGTFPYILTPIPNLYDHSFPRYGQITFLTFRRPTTLTFDLKFWKYLSVTVYPYVICMPSFIMIGWEMAEILHIEILRKHGQTNKHTHKHTNKQTDRHGHYNTSPSPYGGRGNYFIACLKQGQFATQRRVNGIIDWWNGTFIICEHTKYLLDNLLWWFHDSRGKCWSVKSPFRVIKYIPQTS